ncbi:MAG: prefoldin subunit alpha, prefoldin alpha subunit [Thaumarchaeota archaeon CSP1-1]|nr:MAG: prefoldin subunit alpha, prefoldin alpha subunit [Thaumarchaeota archaeon CSP1-1]
MSEEQAQQLMYQMQMLENYFGELTQKEESLIRIIGEASSAIESIKSISEKPESSTLVPIGMGSFVKANISSDDKFILNLGAGVAIEKDKNSTINFIEARIKEMEVALRDTSTQKQHVMANLEQGKQEMNRLIQASRSKNQ